MSFPEVANKAAVLLLWKKMLLLVTVYLSVMMVVVVGGVVVRSGSQYGGWRSSCSLHWPWSQIFLMADLQSKDYFHASESLNKSFVCLKHHHGLDFYISKTLSAVLESSYKYIYSHFLLFIYIYLYIYSISIWYFYSTTFQREILYFLLHVDIIILITFWLVTSSNESASSWGPLSCFSF